MNKPIMCLGFAICIVGLIVAVIPSEVITGIVGQYRYEGQEGYWYSHETVYPYFMYGIIICLIGTVTCAIGYSMKVTNTKP